jgi:hypothetical protein
MTMGSLCGRRSHCCQDDGRGGTANPSIDDNVLRTATMMAIDAIVFYVNVFLVFFMSVGAFFFIVGHHRRLDDHHGVIASITSHTFV